MEYKRDKVDEKILALFISLTAPVKNPRAPGAWKGLIGRRWTVCMPKVIS
jgi:hypothetical protein